MRWLLSAAVHFRHFRQDGESAFCHDQPLASGNDTGAPLGTVDHPGKWPDWWPHLVSVDRLVNGDRDGVGSQHTFLWRSGLGYVRRVVMTTRRVERWRELEAAANGDLRV